MTGLILLIQRLKRQAALLSQTLLTVVMAQTQL